jgi:hypothetical protein
VLVELHIDPDVRGAHCLLRKLPDFLDSNGGFLLEGAAGNQPVIDKWFETSGISALCKDREHENHISDKASKIEQDKGLMKHRK